MARPRPFHSGRHLVALSVVIVASLSACATGLRPSFDEEQPPQADTGDAAVDAVLQRLDAVDQQQFTADYTILTRLGSLNSTATVVQADNSRRSITVNQVRFVNGPGITATCDLATGECEASINDARTSDVQVSHDFYGVSMARRLRVDAGRKIDNATAHQETIAGQAATCADVPVSGGVKTYCALDSGVLARYDGADLLIELTSFSDTPDESKFATS